VEACYGRAVGADGQSYVLEYCGTDGHVWKQYDRKNRVESEPVRSQHPEDQPGPKGSDYADEGEPLDTTTPVQYSIKFYYTQEFADITPDIEGFVQRIIDKTNEAYEASLVPLSTYALCTELATNINDYNSDKVLDEFVQLKGSPEELRDTADVAVLLTRYHECGIGKFNSFKSGNTFSVVSKECAEDNYSVAHEIGHNFGLGHDKIHDPENEAYSFGHGHYIEKGRMSTGYRTIMAYPRTGYMERHNFFSNPKQIHSWTATYVGTENANNALVLMQNRFDVAKIGNESSRTCQPRGGRISTAADEPDQEESSDRTRRSTRGGKLRRSGGDGLEKSGNGL
jgi:predicted Zn-dependent protease with MMP-like domain